LLLLLLLKVLVVTEEQLQLLPETLTVALELVGKTDD
jgi:hypothetical protein